VSVAASIEKGLSPEAAECLRFVTESKTKPMAVDLTIFATGVQPGGGTSGLRALHRILRKGGLGSTPEPFRGRPELITQLAPAFRELYLFQSRVSVRGGLASLYEWFRFFDDIEAKGTALGKPVPAVNRAEDITEVHRQLALDAGITWQHFGPFKRVLNLTRQGMKLRELPWPEPERPDPKRVLPDIAHITALRHEFKHRWFAAVDRWSRMDSLINEESGLSAPDRNARENYLWLQDAMASTGKGWPSFDELTPLGPGHFYQTDLSVRTMLSSRYADRNEVLAAFHLCLSTTGWNPQTLLDFDATNSDALRSHPKDATRYVMRAFKARSKLYQFSEGLWKSKSAPGVVIHTLIERTAPLRLQLQRELEHAQVELKRLQEQGGPREEIDASRLTVTRLAEGTRSAWLYPDNDGTIGWLADGNWGKTNGGAYLTKVVHELNARRPPDKQIPHFRPSDFRDGFAAFAYLHSGGMVYFVMRVLGHKWVKSTEAYIRNTFLNERSINVYRAFANGIWQEIKIHKRLDPTILALVTRDGSASTRQRRRIAEYRQLRKSRLGVGCLDPFHPPKAVAPGFRANGKRKCSTQRCTLCIENAVIFKESLDGLAMRWAELMWLKQSIPVLMFSDNSFQEELENTEAALYVFDPEEVDDLKRKWQQLIRTGEHVPPQFELIAEGAYD
jgi:hypothetical protein